MAIKFLICVLLVAGCNDTICARKSDCAADMTCSPAGVCVSGTDRGTSSSDPATDGGVVADAEVPTVDGGQ